MSICNQTLVFLFPGLSGDVSELDSLRLGCSSAITFISISYPYWTTIRYDAIDLGILVGHCRAQILRQAALGTVILTGYSFGGHVAIAVAASLAESHNLDLLVCLLDTPALPVFPRPIRTSLGKLQRFIEIISHRDGRGKFVAGIIARRIINVPQILRLTAILCKYRSLSRTIEHLDMTLQMNHYIPILYELLKWMVDCNRFQFRTVLFRCAEQMSNQTADLGWRAFLDDLHIKPMEGNHMTFMSVMHAPMLCASFVQTLRENTAAPSVPTCLDGL